jgi:uncharacterized surface protein with fasciclin (FAS1) repeats
MNMKKMIGILLAVMLVFSFSNGTLAAKNQPVKKDIVDTAVAAGNFKILTAALQKAGLVETLKGPGPYTVFAPTDAAFEMLLKEMGITANELLAKPDLKNILLNHVLSGKVMSSDLKNGMKAKSLAQKDLTFTLNPVKVNNAKVTKPDIETSNGVIHVIDAVLLP